jgi:hypothetical protein
MMLVSHYILHAVYLVLGSIDRLINPKNEASASERECKLRCD